MLVAYGPAERRAAIRRFQEKKKRALCPRIRYSVRKKLADVRPRKHGRFYKPADATEVATAAATAGPPPAADGEGMEGVAAAVSGGGGGEGERLAMRAPRR